MKSAWQPSLLAGMDRRISHPIPLSPQERGGTFDGHSPTPISNAADAVHASRMLSAAECRARAVSALARADQEADPDAKVQWLLMFREWTALAVSTDAIEAAQDNLIERGGI